MKHSLLTHAASLLLLGGALLLAPLPMQAQQHEPAAWKQPAKAPSARNGLCDLLPNGDFEVQTVNSGPTRINNLAGGYSQPPSSANQSTPGAAIPTELAGWTSPTEATPDYYATNANPSNPTSAAVNPSTGIYGTFTPVGGTGGSVGLGTYEQHVNGQPTRRVSEYITTDVAGLTDGLYYASFQVQVSGAGGASTRAVDRGFGLQVSNGALPFVNDQLSADPTDDFLQPSGRGLLTTTPLGAANIGTWTPVRGTVYVASGDHTLTIGLFNPNDPVTNVASGNAPTFAYRRTLLNGSTDTALARTYFFVDDVQLFRVPTAGPRRPCTGGSLTPVTIGEGCPIPGATYVWRKGNASAPVFATTLQTSVYPNASSFYFLTVTLPDGTTSTTSTIVYACPCPTPSSPSLEPPTWNCAAGAGPVKAFMYNYDASATYTITTTGDVQNTPSPGTVFANPSVSSQGYYYLSATKSGGTGTVTVKVTNSCGNSASYTITITIPNYDKPCAGRLAAAAATPTPTATTAYPNPAGELLNLPAAVTEAVLLNNQGQAVQRPDANGQLDVRGLPAGLYNLQMRQDGKLLNQHVEVRH